MFGHLIGESDDEKRARRDRALRGFRPPTPEELRDATVMREVHAANGGCPRCNTNPKLG